MAELFGYATGSFASTPSSQARAASSPSRSRTAVTKAWKDPLVGAQPIRPFQRGSVKPWMVSGRSSGVRSSVLYTNTRARPVVPTQRPLGSRNRAGTRSRMESGSGLSRPSLASWPSAPASWP